MAQAKIIAQVMINTNGIRLARDQELRDTLAHWPARCRVNLQMDGLDDHIYPVWRGELLESDFFPVPCGHGIPFDANNVLYRDGHLPLPRITRARGKGDAAQ